MATTKALIRAGTRKATRSEKVAPAEVRGGRASEPTVCKGCGAVFARRVWRTDRKVTHALLERAQWKICPACKQQASDEYLGRVVIRGAYAVREADAIRARIANVEARAKVTQPQRRIVSADKAGASIEVLTTSQKLAHRIVAELKKAFRGRARYEWSDDGSLYAVWERD